MLRTAQLPPPRFAAGISANTGGFATGDLGVSPDRALTGRLPQACARSPHVMRALLVTRAPELLDAHQDFLWG